MPTICNQTIVKYLKVKTGLTVQLEIHAIGVKKWYDDDFHSEEICQMLIQVVNDRLQVEQQLKEARKWRARKMDNTSYRNVKERLEVYFQSHVLDVCVDHHIFKEKLVVYAYPINSFHNIRKGLLQTSYDYKEKNTSSSNYFSKDFEPVDGEKRKTLKAMLKKSKRKKTNPVTEVITSNNIKSEISDKTNVTLMSENCAPLNTTNVSYSLEVCKEPYALEIIDKDSITNEIIASNVNSTDTKLFQSNNLNSSKIKPVSLSPVIQTKPMFKFKKQKLNARSEENHRGRNNFCGEITSPEISKENNSDQFSFSTKPVNNGDWYNSINEQDNTCLNHVQRKHFNKYKPNSMQSNENLEEHTSRLDNCEGELSMDYLVSARVPEGSANFGGYKQSDCVKSKNCLKQVVDNNLMLNDMPFSSLKLKQGKDYCSSDDSETSDFLSQVNVLTTKCSKKTSKRNDSVDKLRSKKNSRAEHLQKLALNFVDDDDTSSDKLYDKLSDIKEITCLTKLYGNVSNGNMRKESLPSASFLFPEHCKINSNNEDTNSSFDKIDTTTLKPIKSIHSNNRMTNVLTKEPHKKDLPSEILQSKLNLSNYDEHEISSRNPSNSAIGTRKLKLNKFSSNRSSNLTGTNEADRNKLKMQTPAFHFQEESSSTEPVTLSKIKQEIEEGKFQLGMTSGEHVEAEDIFADCFILEELSTVNDIDVQMEKNIHAINEVHELSAEQVDYLVKKNEPYLREIFQGEKYCRRHEDYKKGGNARIDLNYQVRLGILTEVQEDQVMETLLGMFCKKHSKYLEYVMKVMLPEILIKLYMDIHNTTHSEAEKQLNNDSTVPNSLQT